MTARMTAAQYRDGAAAVPTEHEECTWLTDWARAQTHRGWRVSEILIHIPNGAYHGSDRKAGAVVARKLREQGLQSGVFDYILPVPIPRLDCPGLWIEMKRTRGGRVSEDQKTFMKRMVQLGWRCAVCRGWVEAAEAITQHLKETTWTNK